MQIEDFVKAYQAKSDEELIELAVAREQLTSKARLALEVSFLDARSPSHAILEPPTAMRMGTVSV